VEPFPGADRNLPTRRHGIRALVRAAGGA